MNIELFREITQDFEILESDIKELLRYANGNIDRALNRYYEEQNRKKRDAELLRGNDGVIDVSRMRGEKNAFNRLKYGAVLEYNKKKVVAKQKDEYKSSMMEYRSKQSQQSDPPINGYKNRDIEHYKTIDPFNKPNRPTPMKKPQKRKMNAKSKDLSGFFAKKPESPKPMPVMVQERSTNKKLTKISFGEMEESYKKVKSHLEKQYIFLGSIKEGISITVTLSDRLPTLTPLSYKVEKRKVHTNLEKRFKIKQSDKLGYIHLKYDDIELCRLVKYEDNLFRLLNRELLRLELCIHKDSENYERNDYVLEIFFFIRLSHFTLPLPTKLHKSSDQISQSSMYTELKQETEFLLAELGYIDTKDSKWAKIKSDNAKDFFIKKNFYNLIDNIKFDTQDCRDNTPSSIFKLKLHEFQLYGLNWLISKEVYQSQEFESHQASINPMWVEFKTEFMTLEKPTESESEEITAYLIKQNPKNNQGDDSFVYFYFNLFTGQLTFNYPHYDLDGYISGGILADEMGLGKTIMILALIGYSTVNTEHRRFLIKNHEEKLERKHGKSKKSKDKEKPMSGTLVILPKVLVHQWEEEIQKVFARHSISYFKYQNIDKKEAIDLSGYDIVLTSYGQVRRDYHEKKYKHNLFTHRWYRIVLDEANKIHNTSTQLAMAIMKLDGCAKWCVTGTPIENSLNDLFSLIHFLDYQPWAEKAFFEKVITKELYNNHNLGILKTLRSVISPLIMRRTKKNHIDVLNLKDIEYNDIVIELDEEERAVYSDKYSLSQKAMSDAENTRRNFLHVYELILRLRQICNHARLPYFKTNPITSGTLAKLLQKFITKRMKEKRKSKEAVVSDPDLSTIQETLEANILNNDTCTICMDEIDSKVVTVCLHMFCLTCFHKSIKANMPCAFCRYKLTKQDKFPIAR